MLGRSDRPGAWAPGDVDPAVPLAVMDELLDEAEHPLARMGDEREVEATVPLVPALDVMTRDAIHVCQGAIELGQVLPGEARHADGDRQSLDDDARRVQLLEIPDREGCDPPPPVELGLDQSLALEQSERLAHRAAADPE